MKLYIRLDMHWGDKMESTSRKIGVILSYLLVLIQTIIGLLYVPLLLKYLNQNEYGLYQLMGSLIGYFSIMDFGLSNALTSFYSKSLVNDDNKKIENLLFTAKTLYNIVSFFLMIVAFVFYFFIDYIFGASLMPNEIQEAKYIFILLIINIVITLKTNIYTSVITGQERFIFLKTATIIQVLIQPIMIISILKAYPYAFVIALIQTILNFGLGVVKGIYCHARLGMKIKFCEWDKQLIHSLVQLSLSIFLVSIADQIFWKTNQFILGIISGTAAVAVYSIAAQIYMNYMPLSTTIQSVFLPHVSKEISKNDSNDYINSIFLRVGRMQYMLLLLVLSGFIVFGKEFIRLWAGEQYIIAYYIAVLILIPFTIDLIQNTGLIIMQVKNTYGYRAKVYSLIAIINIFLSTILGLFCEEIGCGIATSISMLISNIIMNIYYSKQFNINIKQFWAEIIKFTIPIIPLVILSFAGKLIISLNSWSILVVEIIIYTILYILIIYNFSMKPNEKDYFFNRIFNKKTQ